MHTSYQPPLCRRDQTAIGLLVESSEIVKRSPSILILVILIAFSFLENSCGRTEVDRPRAADIDAPATVIRLKAPGRGPGRGDDTAERAPTVIKLGDIVRWVNEETSDQSVTSPIGLFDSGRMKPGQSFSVQFNKPGSFHYTSVFDPTIRGIINVHTQTTRALIAPEEPTLTALSEAKPITDLKMHLIPEWKNFEDVRQGFSMITAPSLSIPWDYVFDGCFARAALAAEHLEKAGLRRPAKLFIFGPLAFAKEDLGMVTWWYHVAPVVAFDGTAYVLDPSIQPSGPLLLKDWVSRISSDPSEATLAVCNPFSYQPWSMCYVSGPDEEAGAHSAVFGH